MFPLAFLLLLLLGAPGAGPRKELVLVKEAKSLAVVLESPEDQRLGFNRRCLAWLRYPENLETRRQCFPSDADAAALQRSRDLEVFLALRDRQLAEALAALPADGFASPQALGDLSDDAAIFQWADRKASLRLGRNAKNRPALLLAVHGAPAPRSLLTLEDLPPANDPSVAMMERLGLRQVLLLGGRTVAVVLDHAWVREGQRHFEARLHFLPLKAAAKAFGLPLPLEPNKTE